MRLSNWPRSPSRRWRPKLARVSRIGRMDRPGPARRWSRISTATMGSSGLAAARGSVLRLAVRSVARRPRSPRPARVPALVRHRLWLRRPAAMERGEGRDPARRLDSPKIVAPAEYLAKAPDLLRAFIRFAHADVGLRSDLTDETLAAIDAWEPEYQQTIRSPRPQGPAALLAALGRHRGHDGHASGAEEPESSSGRCSLARIGCRRPS